MPTYGARLVLGNWKMNGDSEGAMDLIMRLVTEMPDSGGAVTAGIAPSYLHLETARRLLMTDALLLGAQDARAQDSGAFTGDISAAMLKKLGCDFALAGHSERRMWHGERNEHVRQKAEGILRQQMHAVVCIGESKAEREAGQHLQAVEAQLRGSLPAQFVRDHLSVAYEPVWAIGAGQSASPQDIQQMHGHIFAVMQQLSGGAPVPRILYGGSVDANNALDILSLPVVDGVLVGGASLDADAFLSIIRAAAQAASQQR